MKLFALMPRRPDLSVDDFRHHWRHIHADLVKQLTSVRRYVQSYPLDDLPGTAPLPYDGIAEIWYSDRDALASATTDPAYLSGARRDEPEFIDMTRHLRLVTLRHAARAGATRASAPSSVKALLFMTRSGNRDITDPALLPGARSVIEHRVIDPAASPYDRVLEIWWDDEAAFRADWEQGGSELIGSRGCTGVLVTELQII